jgi:DNA polymerase-3 subunit delta'
VVVIDAADTLNSAAANCLLKTLEEPPDDTVLVLVSCAAGRLLPTIVSRCQHVRFAPLAREDIHDVLVERGHDPGAAAAAARQAQGSLARAALFLDPGYRERRTAMAEALARHGGGAAEALALARSLAGAGVETGMLFEFLREWYRDLLLTAEHMPEDMLCNPDMASQLRAAAAGARPDDIMRIMRNMNLIQQDAALNIEAQHALERVLIR